MQLENRPPVIEVEGVGFTYATEPVLTGVSFTVGKGDYVGIIGPNGGGKSTLLKIILGLLSPSTGRVRLFGEELGKFKSWQRIGYLPQRGAQFDLRFPISVEEVVSQGRIARAGWLRGFSAEDRLAIEKAMRITETPALRARLVGGLSGGELQRVLIARALASEPEVLLLDEPVVGVDPASQEKFYRFLRTLNRDLGLTILFVSHDIDVVYSEVSCVLCLNRGLVSHGRPEDVLTELNLKELYGKNIRLVLHGH